MLSEIDAALEIPGEEKRQTDGCNDSEERKSQEAYVRNRLHANDTR